MDLDQFKATLKSLSPDNSIDNGSNVILQRLYESYITATAAVPTGADVQTLSTNQTQGGTKTLSHGAAAAAIAQRFGKSITEGTEIRVIDEVVTLTAAVKTALTNTVPSGAVIVSVQANNNSLVVGDGTGDDGLIKVGIGIDADPNKYGMSADLVKNHKTNTLPAHAVLSGAETIGVYAVDTAGDAVTEKFVAGGLVRVRIVFFALASLDNAA